MLLKGRKNKVDERSEKISRIVAAHSRKLIAYSRLICRDVEIARDAAADTFLKLCSLKNIDEGRISAWLYKTCRNRTIDILRRQKFCVPFDEEYKNARRRIRRFEPRQGTSFAPYSKTSKIAGGGSNAQIFFRPKIRRYLGDTRHIGKPRVRSRFPCA